MKPAVLMLFRATLMALVVSGPILFALHSFQHSTWRKQRLYSLLVTGSQRERLHAASALVQIKAEQQLLQALQDGGTDARAMARKALEYLWFNAAGPEAFQLTQSAHNAANDEDFDHALALLNKVLNEYSEFAEGWNQRASLYWQMGEWQKSIDDSRRAVALNPSHYGAWQGLGVCLLKLGEIDEACRCLRRALEILPHDKTTQEALEECEKLLPKRAPDVHQRRTDVAQVPEMDSYN